MISEHTAKAETPPPEGSTETVHTDQVATSVRQSGCGLGRGRASAVGLPNTCCTLRRWSLSWNLSTSPWRLMKSSQSCCGYSFSLFRSRIELGVRSCRQVGASRCEYVERERAPSVGRNTERLAQQHRRVLGEQTPDGFDFLRRNPAYSAKDSNAILHQGMAKDARSNLWRIYAGPRSSCGGIVPGFEQQQARSQ